MTLRGALIYFNEGEVMMEQEMCVPRQLFLLSHQNAQQRCGVIFSMTSVD